MKTYALFRYLKEPDRPIDYDLSLDYAYSEKPSFLRHFKRNKLVTWPVFFRTLPKLRPLIIRTYEGSDSDYRFYDWDRVVLMSINDLLMCWKPCSISELFRANELYGTGDFPEPKGPGFLSRTSYAVTGRLIPKALETNPDRYNDDDQYFICRSCNKYQYIEKNTTGHYFCRNCNSYIVTEKSSSLFP